MSKRSVNLLRKMAVPLLHNADNPIAGGRRELVTVDNATVVLTAAQSGATVLLGGSGAGTATLPAVGSGIWFNFMVVSVHQHIVNGGASVLQGCLHHNTNGATIARVVATDETTLTMHASRAEIGDSFRVVSNGTNWYIDGVVNDVMVFS